METKSGRSSKVSDRSTPSSRISRPGLAVDLNAIQENLGALHADTRDSIEAIHADIGGITTIRLRTFRLRHFVYRHFVYYYFPC